MNKLIWFLISLLWQTPVFSKVVELTTPAQAKAELAKSGDKVLLYHTTWCGACAMFRPTYEAVSETLRGVKFYAMDCDKIQLKEHEKLFNVIPTAYAGRNESELRNRPCDILTQGRTTESVIQEIKRCLK